MSQLAFPLESPFAGRARRTDPEPSHAAAKQCDAEGERAQILRQLRVHPEGLTADELEVWHGGKRVHRGQVATRLAGLRTAGMVETLDFFRWTPNKSQVWWIATSVDVETGSYL